MSGRVPSPERNQLRADNGSDGNGQQGAIDLRTADGRFDHYQPTIIRHNDFEIGRENELRAEDFMALNYTLFGIAAPQSLNMDGSRLVVAVVAGYEILVHSNVLVHSDVFYQNFDNPPAGAIPNQLEIRGAEINQFKLVMLAMYGLTGPLDFATYAGRDYIKALSLAYQADCDMFVYNSLAEATREFFHQFRDWPTIPINRLTKVLHIKLIMGVDEAFKLYRQHRDAPIAHLFPLRSFAILLFQFCPSQVYARYRDKLDEELVEMVRIIGLFRRDNPDIQDPFTADETSLFTSPFI
ncbi:hypothetical protein GGS20DRAFT_518501 [Poronia punctata]|nr:hypothetical protein GGS20DRAFT_518501 [Poronia punctata]